MSMIILDESLFSEKEKEKSDLAAHGELFVALGVDKAHTHTHTYTHT
jgi:hypothetical protein